MVRINYSPSAKDLIAKSQDYQGFEEVVYPSRGNIYDRSGHILATNKIAYEVGIDLKFVTDPESIAFTAASLLDMEYADAFTMASTQQQETDENRYFVLASYVDEDIVLELERLKESYYDRRLEEGTLTPSLSGLVWTPMQQRSYPENQLAANVLGFFNYFSRETAQGVYGVEEAYNRLLTGEPKASIWRTTPIWWKPCRISIRAPALS